MRKEELMKIEGMTDAIADKVVSVSAEELKGFIPKSRFDEVNEAKKNAEALIKERDKQLEELKKAAPDSEALKKQIEELQNTNKEAKAKYEADIRKMQLDNAINNALRDAGARNVKSVIALLTDMDKAEFDEKGNVKGLADQIKKLQESDSYLFEGTQQQQNGVQNPKFVGMTPQGNGGGQPTGTLTKADFAKMSYKQRVELYNTNKALYDTLSENTNN